MAQRSTPAAGKAPNVAIVGGGLVGVMLGVSLAHRGIPFTLYERASGFHEIGAGIALLTVARDTMKRLNPATYEALSRVATKNYWKYWDGCSPRTKEAAHGPEAFQFLLDGEGNEYWCCLRSVLLRELVAMLPEGSTVFNKELDSYVDDPKSPKVVLRFKDGTSVETDACKFSAYARDQVLTVQQCSAVMAFIRGPVNSFWERTTRRRSPTSPTRSDTAPCSLWMMQLKPWARRRGVRISASTLGLAATSLPIL